MLEENTNSQNFLKDSKLRSIISSSHQDREMSITVSYTKTNKLISALYMVTDIMDTVEPIRNKLRTLGINIISDINSFSKISLNNNINEVESLLDIASSVGIVSEMNYSILRKEFNELKLSIEDNIKEDNSNWLKDFFEEEACALISVDGQSDISRFNSNKSSNDNATIKNTSIGRVGVQKGSTLLKALSEIEKSKKVENLKISNGHSIHGVSSPKNQSVGSRSGFDKLKKERRELILRIIKNCPIGEDKNGWAGIKDIMQELKNKGQECGEKTLQRELVSMTQDGVLNKTGEKRWSRYSVVKSS